MTLASNFELMARYNQWMNERIYAAAGQLDDAALRADRGAFFTSIFGTLNHNLIGDILWLKRFARHPRRYPALTGLADYDDPPGLDALIYPELDACERARRALDDAIAAWSRQVTDEDLAGDFSYANSGGDRFTSNFGQVVHHFYNHQTHHRGQLTTLLSQCGIDPGATDLLVLIRDPAA